MSLSSHANNLAKKLNATLILKAPQPRDIKYFNEQPSSPNAEQSVIIFQRVDAAHIQSVLPNAAAVALIKSNLKPKLTPVKKKVTFPDDDKIIKDFSAPPKRGWTPGVFSTHDLLESYLKSCERHKCKSLNKLLPQLKALQDLDCSNGEKVNVLNLKSILKNLIDLKSQLTRVFENI